MNKNTIVLTMLLAGLLCVAQARADSVVSVVADANGLPLVPPNEIPTSGTFWVMLGCYKGVYQMAPYPCYIGDTNTPVFLLGDGQFLVGDDSEKGGNYSVEAEVTGILNLIARVQEAALNTELNAMLGFTSEMDSEESESENTPQFGPTDLWLEVLLADTTNNLIFLRLHNTVASNYQIESKTNLLQTQWQIGQFKSGDITTNFTDFAGIAMLTSNMFFRAHQSDEVVSIGHGPDTIQTNPAIGNPLQIGHLTFDRSLSLGTNPPLTIYYSISGTANNGMDYTGANGQPLSGQITFGSGVTSTNLEIFPITNRLYLETLTVVLTIIPTNAYLIDPRFIAATNLITEPLFAPVVFLGNPVGIDYHAISNSLIVSCGDNSGLTNEFETVYTEIVSGITNIVVTNWSSIPNLVDEVEVATVKRTVAGFTNGETFFGSLQSAEAHVGRINSTGNNWDLNWCVLTNEPLSLQGGVYVDETGTFSNNLVAISGHPNFALDCNVYLVGSNRQARLLATITNAGLEGVITITNDPAKWGPWAGKILTGDENTGILYTIDTNGVPTQYPLGIEPESFNLITTNQNYYVCDAAYPWPLGGGQGAILKLPSSYFANYVGQLAILQADAPNGPPTIFIVRWDSGISNFVVSARISYTRPDGTAQNLEHATFAPIDIPYAP